MNLDDMVRPKGTHKSANAAVDADIASGNTKSFMAGITSQIGGFMKSHKTPMMIGAGLGATGSIANSIGYNRDVDDATMQALGYGGAGTALALAASAGYSKFKVGKWTRPIINAAEQAMNNTADSMGKVAKHQGNFTKV